MKLEMFIQNALSKGWNRAGPVMTIVILGTAFWSANARSADISIVQSAKASTEERLAAKELRRYIYLRTGELPEIRNDAGKGDLIVIGIDDSLERQGYRIVTADGNRRIDITGGSPIGSLYGSYRLIEELGIRFYLHGDVIPDEKIPWQMPRMDEKGEPLFELRGLNPWGSHPFGFDQWGAEDYKAIISQLAKMRMNFIGMHCYLTHPYDEPTVWVGTKNNINDNGTVKSSYPSRYYNTSWKGRWGPILPGKTGDYPFGASLLFEDDTWGPPSMKGFCPTPATPEDCIELHNRIGRQFEDAFRFARLVGVKTCLGTEAPLKKFMPSTLKEALKAEGKDPNDQSVVSQVYEGIFERLKRSHPLDYYWIWTPEGWTWGGNSETDFIDTVNDVRTAMEAIDNTKAPFQLATSGWVLGPKHDRAAFDKAISKTITMSAISRQLGHTPLDPAFGRIGSRDTWAIPWLESDSKHGLAGLQLFAGRTFYDGAQAKEYGCSGLMGLHWRTRDLAPNVSALAKAGWKEQKDFPAAEKTEPSKPEDRVLGGQTANYPGKAIAGTEEDVLYQTCRYNMEGYRLAVPNGEYRVTLKFCEPHFNSKAKRVCDIRLQSETVLSDFDIFGTVGQFAAHDEIFDGIKITDGQLTIDIINRVSMACISGIVAEKGDFSKKINCGGPAWKDYLPDPADSRGNTADTRRKLPVDDFYLDFAESSFGTDAAKKIANLFARIDSRVPISVSGGCPAGSLNPDMRPWHDVEEQYDFVREMAELKPEIKGAGNIERFDYWLNTFRYHSLLHKIRCDLGRFETVMKKVETQKDAALKAGMTEDEALPVYKELLDEYANTVRLRMETVTTHGGVATVVNLLSHAQFWNRAIEKSGDRLKAGLGRELPAAVVPSSAYKGAARIFMPTVRNVLTGDEPLSVKVVVLDSAPVRDVGFYWRPLGGPDYSKVKMTHVARGTFLTELAAEDIDGRDIEYYITARKADGGPMHYPVTAPRINNTVTVFQP